jgi:hypothetical protein
MDVITGVSWSMSFFTSHDGTGSRSQCFNVRVRLASYIFAFFSVMPCPTVSGNTHFLEIFINLNSRRDEFHSSFEVRNIIFFQRSLAMPVDVRLVAHAAINECHFKNFKAVFFVSTWCF